MENIVSENMKNFQIEKLQEKLKKMFVDKDYVTGVKRRAIEIFNKVQSSEIH